MKKTPYKFILNLQLFADEKTEEATPKRKKDTREKGQVVKSVELNATIIIIATFLGYKLLTGYIYKNVLNLFKKYINYGNVGLLSVNNIEKLNITVIEDIALIAGPLLLITFFVAAVINYAQVGFLFTTKTLTPQLNKINPINGFKRIFSKKSLVEMLKSLLKIAIIGYVIYVNISSKLNEILYSYRLNDQKVTDYLWNTLISFVLSLSLPMLVIAAADYFYQWFDFRKNIKMTKEEIKEEFKETEGNPQIKSRIKDKQREFSRMRMMQSVPKADVVIVNPTHYAVAIRYKENENRAPVVIAKGQDYVALKIKEIARENGIEIVENKPLAQALYKTTNVGQEIPENMYRAVAEILAYIYKLKKNH